jgi:hypothetical protein
VRHRHRPLPSTAVEMEATTDGRSGEGTGGAGRSPSSHLSGGDARVERTGFPPS